VEEEGDETNYIVFLGTQEVNSHLELAIIDTKPCEFNIEELLSMHIKQNFSFVLTKNSDVLVFGNFANLLSNSMNQESNAEFLKLAFFNDL
jgi:hypothetical protein